MVLVIVDELFGLALPDTLVFKPLQHRFLDLAAVGDFTGLSGLQAQDVDFVEL